MQTKKDKILLVYPKLGDAIVEVPNLPLSLLSVGSYLYEVGYNVVILDAHNWGEQELRQKIKENIKDSLCVGFSVKTAQVPHALALSKLVKKNSSIPVVWGGKHPSLFPEQTAMNEHVDFVVVDEGEETFLQLIMAVKDKTMFKEVDGIAFKKGKECILTKERAPLNMDGLPFLKFDLVEGVKNSNLAEIANKKRAGLPLITSRGCPHRCAFCINTALKERYRLRSTTLVIEELQMLHNLGVRKIHFMDECFFGSKKRLKELLDEMIKRGFEFKWYGSVRVDYFNENFIDMELLSKIKESGCVFLGVGAESGSQRILDKIKKDIKIEDTIRSAEMLSEVEIPTTYSFMIGLPSETREDMYATLKLILKITEIYPGIEIYGPQIYRPYPGSELYEEVKDQLEFPKTLEEWESKRLLFGERSNVPIDYPWLQVSEKELKKLRFYGSNANGFIQLYRYHKKYKIIEKVITGVIRWRISHSFYRLPFDYILYQSFYNISSYLKYRKRTE